MARRYNVGCSFIDVYSPKPTNRLKWWLEDHAEQVACWAGVLALGVGLWVLVWMYMGGMIG